MPVGQVSNLQTAQITVNLPGNISWEEHFDKNLNSGLENDYTALSCLYIPAEYLDGKGHITLAPMSEDGLFYFEDNEQDLHVSTFSLCMSPAKSPTPSSYSTCSSDSFTSSAYSSCSSLSDYSSRSAICNNFRCWVTDPPKKNRDSQDEISEDDANTSLMEETPQLILSSHCEVKPKVYRSEFNVCITLHKLSICLYFSLFLNCQSANQHSCIHSACFILSIFQSRLDTLQKFCVYM